MATSLALSQNLETKQRDQHLPVLIKFLKRTISLEMRQQWSDLYDITFIEDGTPYLTIELHDPSQKQGLLIRIELSQRLLLAKM